MLNKIIAPIVFILPCISYANIPAGTLISKALAKDVSVDYGVGKVYGPVKRLIIWEGSDRKGVSYDREGRIEYIDFGLRKETHKFLYTGDEKLPAGMHTKSQISKFKTLNIYLRDEGGNIKDILSKTYDSNGKLSENKSFSLAYEYMPNDVVAVHFQSSPLFGDKISYYKKGLLIKDFTKNGMAIRANNGNFESVRTRIDENRYSYKFNKSSSEPVFSSMESFNEHGVLDFVSWEKYSNVGNLIETFTSLPNNTKVGNYTTYTDYKFDKYSNWIERKRCWTSYSSKGNATCSTDERTITYY